MPKLGMIDLPAASGQMLAHLTKTVIIGIIFIRNLIETGTCLMILCICP